MGVLPLEYLPGDDAKKLGLTGEETFAIRGIAAGLTPGQHLPVTADGKSFEVRVRIDSPQEVDYFVHGGILQYVLRQLAAAPR
jgi:aconitate hydratase